MIKLFGISILIAAMILGAVPALRAEAEKMALTSPAFEEGGWIPEKFTCDGKNISPALKWTSPPVGNQSLVLFAEDWDAPAGLWVHWVLFNIPPTVSNLPEGLPALQTLVNFERNGINDFKNLGYGGPCPPTGTIHHYRFKLYALDAAPRLEAGAARDELLTAMEGHVLAEAQLMGKYRRKK